MDGIKSGVCGTSLDDVKNLLIVNVRFLRCGTLYRWDKIRSQAWNINERGDGGLD